MIIMFAIKLYSISTYLVTTNVFSSCHHGKLRCQFEKGLHTLDIDLDTLDDL